MCPLSMIATSPHTALLSNMAIRLPCTRALPVQCILDAGRSSLAAHRGERPGGAGLGDGGAVTAVRGAAGTVVVSERQIECKGRRSEERRLGADLYWHA